MSNPAVLTRDHRAVPRAAGLIASALFAGIVVSPPSHPYSWPLLLIVSTLDIIGAFAICALAMRAFQCRDRQAIVGTSAVAASFAPLAILVRQHSLLGPVVAAFVVWTVAMFIPARDFAAWKKFLIAFCAAILIQLGVAAALGDRWIAAALVIGLAAAPVNWRIRQERSIGGSLTPSTNIAIALALVILALTRYLPMQFTGSAGTAEAKTNPVPGLPVGGKYRGVILMPEQEEHILLVPPLPMMGRDPFRVHKDPIGIPFYGVYWFFQAPDRAPAPDAYKTRGTPDRVSFRSAGTEGLEMEAHQNLGRLIDVSACSGIDVVIRNADPYPGSISIALILKNTAEGPFRQQLLGVLPVLSRGGADPVRETLSFRMPANPRIEQFDELTIMFQRTRFRATKSARVAIERFFLVPRTSL